MKLIVSFRELTVKTILYLCIFHSIIVKSSIHTPVSHNDACFSDIHIDGILFRLQVSSPLVFDKEVVEFARSHHLNIETTLAVRTYHLLHCYPDFNKQVYGPTLGFNFGGETFIFNMYISEFPGEAVLRFCSVIGVNVQSEQCADVRNTFFSLIKNESFIPQHSSPSSAAYLSMSSLAFGTGGLFTKFILTRYEYENGHNVDGSSLNEECIRQIFNALCLGYIHIDTAEQYGNDRELGAALQLYYRTRRYQRENVWITSKIDNSVFDPIAGVKAIIDRIGCKYLDLLLIHYPLDMMQQERPELQFPSIKYVWYQMEELVSMGLVRYIGVSSFRITDLQELLLSCTIRPFVNYVEFHPYLQQQALRDFCSREGIRLASYGTMAPLTSMIGGPMDHLLPNLAAKYKVSEGAILCRYAQQIGFTVITSTKKFDRLLQLLTVLPAVSKGGTETHLFDLDVEDIRLISSTCEYINSRFFFREQILSRFQKVPKNSAQINYLDSLENTWTPIDFNNKDLFSLQYSEPMKALVNGNISCIIIREVMSQDELSEVLKNLADAKLLVNGRSGSIAMKYNFHRQLFQERLGAYVHTTVFLNNLYQIFSTFFFLNCINIYF